MSVLDRIARLIWGSMLWFLRRPRIRRWRLRFITRATHENREQDKRRFIRQERFARRNGVPLIRLVLTIMIISAISTAFYMFALKAFDEGWIRPPQSVESP